MAKDESAYICECTVIHPEKIEHVKNKMLDVDSFNRLADLYKNFADPTRVKLLWAIWQEEMCVCDLAHLLSMTVSAVSHQLKFLRTSNLVKFRKVGKTVYYSLADDHVKEMLAKGYEHINE